MRMKESLEFFTNECDRVFREGFNPVRVELQRINSGSVMVLGLDEKDSVLVASGLESKADLDSIAAIFTMALETVKEMKKVLARDSPQQPGQQG
jgi:predicted regulator of Ras-like GTPase activity (Roadblock/LC7/MglB family)